MWYDLITMKNSIELPKTLADVEAECRAQLIELNALFEKAREVVKKLVQDQFDSHNGCKKCRGRGWVVVWDTMDSLSGCYAEYGPCPDPKCTEETRKASGLEPGMSIYDSNRNVPNPIETHPAFAVLTSDLKSKIADVNVRIEDVRRARKLGYLDECVVVKGRKVPVGFRGRVCWLGVSCWGQRVGLQAADGTKVYLSADNVEKVA